MLVFRWDRPLVRGTLLRRRHRFILDVRINGAEETVAHCANSGGLEGLVRPGAEIWLSRAPAGRSIPWRWELIRIDGELIGANSWLANCFVKRLLEQKHLPGLKRYKTILTERRIGKHSRIDFELSLSSRSHFIEVKNAHLVYPDHTAYFPDSLTLRSSRQLRVLERVMKQGHLASLLVTAQRPEVLRIRPSDVHDTAFSAALRRASAIGLRVRGLHIEPTLKGFYFRGEVPVDLQAYPTVDHLEWRELNRNFTGWERPKGDPNAAWRAQRTTKRRVAP
jgi:sugar fermentation stimulation protein A